MEYTKLGRIRPVYKGAWSASAAYTTLDIVKNSSGDRAYMALKDVPKGTALTDAAYWGVVLDASDVLAAADEAISAANAAAALAPKPLELAETCQPAQIWPEEGSPLRPVITMLPGQTGSGDPSPENVRPISGRTAVMVTRRGKNLFDFTKQPVLKTSVSVSTTANGIKVTQLYGNNWDYARYDSGIPINASMVGKTFTLSADAKASGSNKPGIILGVCDAKYNSITPTSRDLGTNKRLKASFTVTEDHIKDGRFLCASFYGNSDGTGGTDNYSEYSDIQLEAGPTATDYEPCQGDDFTLALGQTVYGGILDTASGTLTVTHKLIALKDREWTESGKEKGRFLSNITMKPYVAPICDVLPGKVWNADSGGASLWTLANNNGDQLIVRTDWNIEDSNAALNEWKAWLAANDPHVCYELATPETVQLDPAVIPALAGLNTVTSTGEGMTLTYNKSLVREHGEIMARLAALEAAALGNT